MVWKVQTCLYCSVLFYAITVLTALFLYPAYKVKLNFDKGDFKCVPWYDVRLLRWLLVPWYDGRLLSVAGVSHPGGAGVDGAHPLVTGPLSTTP